MGNESFKNKTNANLKNEREVTSSDGVTIKYHITSTVTDEVNLVAEYNEVYAYATFLNKYPVAKSPYKLNETDYPHFMFLNCGATKINKLHKELFEKGFYKQASTYDMLTIFKVAELKDIAEKLKIEIKGKKDDLIEQLSEKTSYEAVKSVIKTDVYSLSEKAEQYLDDHKIEIEYYRLAISDLTLQEYAKQRETTSQNDIMLKILLKNASEDKEQFGRSNYLSIGSIYESKGMYKEALASYIRTLFIDLSGVFAYRLWVAYPDDPEFRQESYGEIAFAPGVIRYITNLAEHYTVDVIDLACTPQLPIEACSRNMLKEIVELALNGTLMESQEIRDKITDALKKNFVNIASNFSVKKTKTINHEKDNLKTTSNESGKAKKELVDYEQVTERVSNVEWEKKQRAKFGWELIKEFVYKNGDSRATFRRNRADEAYQIWIYNDKLLDWVFLISFAIKKIYNLIVSEERKPSIIEKIFGRKKLKIERNAFKKFTDSILSDYEKITDYFKKCNSSLELNNSNEVGTLDDIKEHYIKYGIKVENEKVYYTINIGFTYYLQQFTFHLPEDPEFSSMK